MERLSREKFILSMIAVIIVDVALYYFMVQNSNESGVSAFYIAFIVIVGVKLMLIVGRLHDINLSGLYALLALVPVINFGVLALFFIDGTKGKNKYGADPLKRAGKENKNTNSKATTSSSPSREKPLTLEQIEAKLQLLEESIQEGVLTEKEYNTKKGELVKQKNKSVESVNRSKEIASKKEKLNALLKNGILNQEEYNSKLKALTVGVETYQYQVSELHQNSMMYYISKGKEHGPFPVKKIISLVNSEEINPSSLIRHQEENTFNKRAQELFQVLS